MKQSQFHTDASSSPTKAKRPWARWWHGNKTKSILFYHHHILSKAATRITCWVHLNNAAEIPNGWSTPFHFWFYSACEKSSLQILTKGRLKVSSGPSPLRFRLSLKAWVWGLKVAILESDSLMKEDIEYCINEQILGAKKKNRDFSTCILKCPCRL